MHAATGGAKREILGHRFRMGGPGTTGPPAGDGPGKGSILTMSRLEKELSSPNLKVTADLPVVGSFLPLFENFLRILQLCHQYS